MLSKYVPIHLNLENTAVKRRVLAAGYSFLEKVLLALHDEYGHYLIPSQCVYYDFYVKYIVKNAEDRLH